MFCTKLLLVENSSFIDNVCNLSDKNYPSDFETLLEDGNERPVHQKCTELLTMKVSKYLNGLSLLISQTPSSN